ncbi:hypothetical protein GL638_00555 [Campylobacter coli]|nr:hypothetical protein [Campylobacter coli]
MKIAFYKVKENDKSTFLDKAIAFFTSSWKERLNGDFLKSYSHCEIILDNLMISSSPRDKGVRIKEFKDTGRWDFIEINDINETKIKEFLYSQIGKKYDFLGILGFFTLTKDSEDKWFCSEIIIRALQIGGLVKLGDMNAGSSSPNRLYKKLKDTNEN